MPNALYDSGRQKFLEGSIPWLTGTIKAVLVDSGQYTLSLSTHSSLADIPVGARISTTAAFTNKTSVAGVADADDVTFPGVTGVTSEYIIPYLDSGTATTSWLICIYDTATGLPVTPSGGDIIVQWSNGPDRIFKL